MKELTVPDVIHRVPPLVEEARRFLKRCRRTARPRVHVWRGGRPRGRRGFGAVYPGSFDPWTKAHEAILCATLRRVRGPVLVLLDLETIDKPSHAAPLADRLAILALHLADEKRVAIGVSTHGRFLEKARALGSATFVVGEDTWERVQAPRYYADPDRELAELHRRARFLVAPRGGRRRGDLPLSSVDQARSATLARRAFAAGRLPWDQLAPDVLLACWQLELYGVTRLMPVWVVTAFLERDGHVLLVKRGQRVGTYKGAWSGVSGYLDWPVRHLRTLIECGPGRWALRQAIQEIHEETSIGARAVRLVNEGREIAADDPSHARQWRVRPFLFRLAPRAQPRLDWENTACEWVTPGDLLHMSIVPKLDVALASACGGWERWYAKRLRELEEDRRSGALEIASGFLRLAEEMEGLGLRASVVRAARRLARSQPMAPPVWIRERILAGIPARELRAELAAQGVSVVRRAAKRLGHVRRIVAYSYSGSVLQTAFCLRRQLLVLHDAEGHGRRLADHLIEFGGKARVVRRAPAGGVLVIGCDAALPDGSIVNARGTARAIREAGLPVIVLAQRCKFIDRCPPLRRGFERVPAGLLGSAEFITG